MNKQLLSLFFFCFCAYGFSQSNVLSSGKDSSSTSGKSTYSVGLIHYKEASGTGGTSSTGSQIALEVTQTLNLDNNNLVSLSIYPNPTSSVLNINVKTENSYQYTLTDLTGKQVLSGAVSNLESKVDLSGLNSAIYILNIKQNNNTIESYKIVKK